jgi:hypothetical protein
VRERKQTIINSLEIEAIAVRQAGEKMKVSELDTPSLLILLRHIIDYGQINILIRYKALL